LRECKGTNEKMEWMNEWMNDFYGW
jgi:hypothetical protein